ncbi:MAG TPA: hypothetical protein VN823_19960 [Stellaceae bacterium]|nr:hypothetical protein [Stellaceae bacterium]
MSAAETPLDPERRRVFILSSGRSGSTLLASILADAGAEFAMRTPEQWDPGTGALEHPELHRMAAWMGYAYDLSADRPGIGPRRYLWDFYRSMGKSRLRSLLRVARYIKGEGADFAVQPAFKMGYFPTIIVSYRRFEAFATSSGLMRGHSNLETLVKYYNRVNRNALLLLRMFGGCVVSYEPLSDVHDTSWAHPLATATGLQADALIAARNRRLRGSARRDEPQPLDATTSETFASLDALRGLAIPPSAQALRSWRGKTSQPQARPAIGTASDASAITSTVTPASSK